VNTKSRHLCGIVVKGLNFTVKKKEEKKHKIKALALQSAEEIAST
jgi:hypothetical protein